MDIIKMLDDYLLDKDRKDRTVVNHWPSNASCIVDEKIVGRCLRSQWYTWKGFKPSNPFDLNARWTMMMGRAIHSELQHIFKKFKIPTGSEVPAKAGVQRLENPISGRVDLMFRPYMDLQKFHHDMWYGLEIKSTYGRAIIDPAYGIKYTGPMKHHLCQILPYMVIKGIPFYILYLARDTGWRICFELTYNEEDSMLYCEGKPTDVTWHGIIDRWELLERYLKEEEIPQREFVLQYPDEKLKPMWEEYREHSKAKRKMTLKAYSKDRGDWNCKRCLYKDLCYGNDLKPNEISEGEKWKQREGLNIV